MVVLGSFMSQADKVTADVMVGLQKAALDIQNEARQRAPVRTGNLRNSIQIQRTGPQSFEVQVQANYGIYVEMGTRYMPARPYLLPAFELVRARLHEYFEGD